MEDSKNQVWTIRLLALLVFSVLFSLFFKFGPYVSTKYKHSIEIKTNDNVGEIITAIEALQREDIHFESEGDEMYMNEPNLISLIIGSFVLIGVVLGIYHALYCLLNALFNKVRSNNADLPYNDLTLS